MAILRITLLGLSLAVCFCGLGSTYGEELTIPKGAQVVIINPQHIAVPDQKVRVLHKLVQEVVGHQFHLRGHQPDRPLELILGEEWERLKLVGTGETDSIYLKTWDETKFVVSDIQLTVQHMVVRDQWERIAAELSRRADQINPVTSKELQNSTVRLPAERIPDEGPCAEAMRDASVRTAPCAIRPVY